MPMLLNLNRQPCTSNPQLHQTVGNADSPILHYGLDIHSNCSSSPISASSISPCINRDSDKKIRKNFFPHKLMDILSSAYFSDCVSWTCDEKAFFIQDPEKFSKKYASHYQMKTVPRKESFARKLNRWGFKMELTKGPYCGSYSHPLFDKNEPWKCEKMGCNKKRGLAQNESSTSLEEDNRSVKRRKFSPTRESTDFDIETILRISMQEQKRLDSVRSSRPDSSDSLFFPKTYEGNQELLLGEVLLRREVQSKRMKALVEFESEARSAYPRNVFGSDISRARLHDTIMKNAMMALV